MNIKEQINSAAQLCDKVAAGINTRMSNFLTFPECARYCPGENKLIDAIKDLLPVLDKLEPELSARLKLELNTWIGPPGASVNPYAYGAIKALRAALSKK